MILITKTAEDLGYTKNIPIIPNISIRSLKRNRNYSNVKPETSKLKFARIMVSYVLLAKATNRDKNYINRIINRVPISINYEVIISDPIFGI
jgi:hypothetical protein